MSRSESCSIASWPFHTRLRATPLGFEIVLLSTLFSIVEADKLDELGRSSSAVAQNSSSASQSGSNAAAAGSISKSPSPRPTLNGRLDSADDDEVETAEPNEVLVSTRLPESAYVEHCLALLSVSEFLDLSVRQSCARETVRHETVKSMPCFAKPPT